MKVGKSGRIRKREERAEKGEQTCIHDLPPSCDHHGGSEMWLLQLQLLPQAWKKQEKAEYQRATANSNHNREGDENSPVEWNNRE